MSVRTSLAVSLLAFAFLACEEHGATGEKDSAMSTPAATVTLEFLTRDGCVNTPKMRQHLSAARQAMPGTKLVVKELNQADLEPGDARGGYPTPTVLMDGEDLFGLPQPTPPYPRPT